MNLNPFELDPYRVLLLHRSQDHLSRLHVQPGQAGRVHRQQGREGAGGRADQHVRLHLPPQRRPLQAPPPRAMYEAHGGPLRVPGGVGGPEPLESALLGGPLRSHGVRVKPAISVATSTETKRFVKVKMYSTRRVLFHNAL